MRVTTQASLTVTSVVLLLVVLPVTSGFHIPNAAVRQRRTEGRQRQHHRHIDTERPKTLSTTSSSSSTKIDDITRLRAGGGTSSERISDDGSASIPDLIFNLVKSIVGAGILSLPAGIAAFGDAPSAILPACLVIALMGAVSAYTFSLIARVCHVTGATSYADAWTKTKGPSTAWIVAASSALDCLAGTVTYSMVLADAMKDLLAALGILTTRSKSLLGLTGLVLLPLCLIQNLSTLAPFSLLGILGMAYTSIAIAIRYFGGAYALPSGRFVADLAPQLRPSFGSTGALGAVTSPKSLLLVSMLSTAYIAHFNAPKFYRELRNNTPERFTKVVASSFGISVVLYAAVSSMAFLTFGGNCAGLILNNYSTKDVLLSLSRFAVALSLVFSYPLLFVGLRDGVLDLMRVPETKRSTALFYQLTVGLLAAITGVALKVTDLTFVASMSGAVLGTSLIFFFPTLMFRAAVREEDDGSKKWERRLCSWIATIGVAIGAVGANMALKNL